MPRPITRPHSVSASNPLIGYSNPVPLKTRKPQTQPRPSPPDLAQLPIDVGQCDKAIVALAKHAAAVADGEGAGKGELLEREERVTLIVTLRKVPRRESHKPISIPLPHPLYDPAVHSICLLTKDPQREYKDLLSSQSITSISRVVGLSKLKGKFKPFEARRQLLREHDLFLADERILEVLGKVLGKMPREEKKQPIPLTLTSPPSNLSTHLTRALSSTHFLLPAGTCLSIRLGSLSSHTPSQLSENLKAVLPHLAVRIPDGGWDNVQSLGVKTEGSVMLPIWNSGLGAGAGAGAGEEEGEGRKRKAVEVEEEEEDGGEKKKSKKRKSDAVAVAEVPMAIPADSLALAKKAKKTKTKEASLVADKAVKAKKARTSAGAEAEAEKEKEGVKKRKRKSTEA